MYKEFKQYVDETTSPIAVFADDLKRVFDHYRVDSSSSLTDLMYDEIRKAIEVKVGEEGAFNKSLFLKIQEDFINRFILLGEDPMEYLLVYRVIHDSCRTEKTKYVSIENGEKWTKAVTYAKSYNLISSTFRFNLDSIRDNYAEYTDRANSIKYILKHGAALKCDAENLTIEKTEIFFDGLEQRIKKVGGLTIAIYLFNLLESSDRYSTAFERFNITRETATIAKNIHPQIPFGYLLNICAKYPYASDKKIAPKEIVDIVKKAVSGCNAVYDIQYYSKWAYLMHSGETVIEKLRNIALWDSIFSIYQVRSANIIKMCAFIFSDITKEQFEQAFNFGLEDFIGVVTYVFKDNGTNLPQFFKGKDIEAQFPNIPRGRVQLILESMSFENNANQGYVLPSDIGNADFFLKSLIRTGDEYLLFFRSWNAPALFEILATGLRKVFNKEGAFDSMVGLKLEMFLRKELTERGISYLSGKYKVEGIEGEADLVIETKEKIILLEIKKKVLTRKAKSGIDTELIVDLSESIIDASMQSARTEILLRKHGKLDLVDTDGKKTTLFYKDREFENISVTQMEFGGLHNKEIMNGLLKILHSYTFHPVSKDDERINGKFAKLKLKQEEWAKQYNSLHSLSESYHHNPYFNYWFISFNQLLEMINLSNSNESFYSNMTMNKHISIGTLDYYFEFLCAKKINDNPTGLAFKMMELSAKKGITYVPMGK